MEKLNDIEVRKITKGGVLTCIAEYDYTDNAGEPIYNIDFNFEFFKNYAQDYGLKGAIQIAKTDIEDATTQIRFNPIDEESGRQRIYKGAKSRIENNYFECEKYTRESCEESGKEYNPDLDEYEDYRAIMRLLG